MVSKGEVAELIDTTLASGRSNEPFISTLGIVTLIDVESDREGLAKE